MDNFADERDFELLEQDKYTFFVLRRILSIPCKLILTDHKRLVICLSSVPYPVWIWTSDDATEEEMQRAYELSMEHGFLDGTHTFNMKYGLAEYFINKSGSKLSVITNMFAYDNPNPIPPSTADKVDGGPYQGKSEDADEFLAQEISVELTPKQQKIEDEINAFLYQEVTWQSFKNFLLQDITIEKKSN